MKNQGITNMQVGPEATLIPPKSPEFILWGSWLYKASSQQIENRWLIRCGPKHGWNLLTGLDKVILHKGILLVMGRGGGVNVPLGAEWESRQMGTRTRFEVDVDFTVVVVVEGEREKPPRTDVHKLLSEGHQHLLLTKTLCPSLRTPR